MKTSDIVLSAASVAAAISALGHLQESGITVSASNTHTEFSEAANHSVTTNQAQRQIRASIPSIASTIRLDGELLSEKYLQIADYRETRSPLLSDSTIDIQANGTKRNNSGFACYTNCHSACHGSRGWR